MDTRGKIFDHPDPYDLPGTEADFITAMRENALYQQAHCVDYARILREQGFNPCSLRTAQDLGRLPEIPTLYFKRHNLFSMK